MESLKIENTDIQAFKAGKDILLQQPPARYDFIIGYLEKLLTTRVKNLQ